MGVGSVIKEPAKGPLLDDRQEKQTDFFTYARTILRQKAVIALCVCLSVSAALTYVFMVKPVYQADAKLLFINEKSLGPMGSGGSMMMSDMMMSSLGGADPIATQIEVLKTRPLYAETIRRLDIKYCKGMPFTFSTLRSTGIIVIKGRHTNPDTAAILVNTLAQVYIENNQNMNQEEMRAAREFIEKQLVNQRMAVQRTEDSVMEFKARTDMTGLDRETNMRVTAIAQLEAEKLGLEAELRGTRAQKGELKRKIGEAGAQSAPAFSLWVNARESAAMSEWGLRARIDALNAQTKELGKGLKNLPPLEVELARLLREQQIAGDIYTILLSQFEEYKVREAAKIASAKLIEPAITPGTPVLPQRRKIVIVAFLAGLFIGVCAAFFIEYLRDRPGSVDEIKNLLHTNPLGVLPWTEKLPPLFMRETPGSAAAEAIRLVHTNLKFKGIMEKGHIALMATSSEPDEGKTTIAVNLALEFAAHGKKTAIVTLDLRRPTFSKMFKLERHKKGLTDYLIGEADLNEIIIWPVADLPNLSVISAGTIPPNPTELIALPRMRELVQQLRDRNDIVLFDTSPVTMVAETLDIARVMDGIILVADISEGSRRSLIAMHDLLADKKLPLLGVVINKDGKGGSGGYGYYHYHRRYRKYGYYTDTNGEKKTKKKTPFAAGLKKHGLRIVSAAGRFFSGKV
jgi:capsular exopolysaccharide synthesis family protein